MELRNCLEPDIKGCAEILCKAYAVAPIPSPAPPTAQVDQDIPAAPIDYAEANQPPAAVIAVYVEAATELTATPAPVNPAA